MQHTVSINTWQPQLSASQSQEIVSALESGKIILFPQLPFVLNADEQQLLFMKLKLKHAKNISFNSKNNEIRGLVDLNVKPCVEKMMSRYQQFCTELLNNIAPSYQASEHVGRTSYRPIEIKGRIAPSYRKDDTRLHVDAFPSTPTNHHRILRIFSNINPYNEARHWQVGESFTNVAQRFLPKIRKPYPFEAEILQFFNVTRKKRLPYDHYMIKIHDTMKGDLDYQNNVAKQDILLPPGYTWMAYTDLVSHAALSGRFLLEQTFYPKVETMQNKALSPLQQIEQLLQH